MPEGRALQSQDLLHEFCVENEFSIFSYRPDIIVVSHSTKGIIFVVEVKKPGVGVFTSREVGGQVYDYLVGSLLSGVAAPFAVLSSYDELCIAHLNDGGVSREILTRNARNLSQDIDDDLLGALDGVEPTPSLMSPRTCQQSGSEKPSPESKLNRVFVGDADTVLGDEDNEGNVGEGSDEEDEEWNRVVCYTQTFSSENSMKALILAIRCGLETVLRSEPRDVPMRGATTSGSCAKVNKSGLIWANMPETIAFNYDHFPGPTTETMYLWRDLGRGSKGRVFLACNANGRACAVKFFLIDFNTYHRQKGTQEERKAWREAEMKAKKADAERERDFWIQVYGDTFKNEVRVVQLNNLWCLMMPYFDQVPDDERESRLGAVEQHLTHFKNLDLMYNTDDLRWRHIGVRHGYVYILDLGSLESCCRDEIDVAVSMETLRTKKIAKDDDESRAVRAELLAK
jgi:hypothetical protein